MLEQQAVAALTAQAVFCAAIGTLLITTAWVDGGFVFLFATASAGIGGDITGFDCFIGEISTYCTAASVIVQAHDAVVIKRTF